MSACVSLTWTAARIIPKLVVYNFETVLNQQFVGKFEFKTFEPESFKTFDLFKSLGLFGCYSFTTTVSAYFA